MNAAGSSWSGARERREFQDDRPGVIAKRRGERLEQICSRAARATGSRGFSPTCLPAARGERRHARAGLDAAPESVRKLLPHMRAGRRRESARNSADRSRPSAGSGCCAYSASLLAPASWSIGCPTKDNSRPAGEAPRARAEEGGVRKAGRDFARFSVGGGQLLRETDSAQAPPRSRTAAIGRSSAQTIYPNGCVVGSDRMGLGRSLGGGVRASRGRGSRPRPRRDRVQSHPSRVHADGEINAQQAGRMLHRAGGRSELAAVGDWVAIGSSRRAPHHRRRFCPGAASSRARSPASSPKSKWSPPISTPCSW